MKIKKIKHIVLFFITFCCTRNGHGLPAICSKLTSCSHREIIPGKGKITANYVTPTTKKLN